jgi:hypothetical protein
LGVYAGFAAGSGITPVLSRQGGLRGGGDEDQSYGLSNEEVAQKTYVLSCQAVLLSDDGALGYD